MPRQMNFTASTIFTLRTLEKFFFQMNCFDMHWQILFCSSTIFTLRTLERFIFQMNCFALPRQIYFSASTIFTLRTLERFFFQMNCFALPRQIHFSVSTIFTLRTLEQLTFLHCLFLLSRQIYFQIVVTAAVCWNSIRGIKTGGGKVWPLIWDGGPKFRAGSFRAPSPLLIIMQKQFFRISFSVNRTLFSLNVINATMEFFIIWMRNKRLHFSLQVMLFYLQQEMAQSLEWRLYFRTEFLSDLLVATLHTYN